MPVSGTEAADEVRRLRFLVELAETTLASSPASAAVLAEQAVALARQLDHVPELGRALFVLAQAHDVAEVAPLVVLEELLSAADQLRLGGNDRTMARALVLLGRVQCELSDFASSAASFSEAQRLALEADDRDLDAQASFGVALILQASDPKHAERFEAHLLAAEAKARAVGDARHEALAVYNLAVAYRMSGWLERSADTFARALTLAANDASQELVVDCWTNLAMVAAARDLLDEARAALDEAEALVRHVVRADVLAGVELARAHVALATGDARAALQALDRSRNARDGPGSEGWQAECVSLAVECHVRLGDLAAALETHRTFHDLSEQVREHHDITRLQALEVVNRTHLARREADQERRARALLEVQAAERERELSDELALVVAHRRVAEERLADDPLGGLVGVDAFCEALAPELAREGHVAVAHLVLDAVALADRTSASFEEVVAELVTRLRAIALTDPRLVLGRRSADVLVAVLGAGDDPVARIESLVNRMRQPLSLGGEDVLPPLVGGVVLAPDHGRDARTLLERAHLAARSIRVQRREVLRRFEPALEDTRGLRRFIERELRDALDTDALTLHYQPEIECRTGQVVGAEALLRWNHPVRGEISPATFIPIAEDSDLIIDVGQWVLRRACAQAHVWRDVPRLVVSANVSVAQVLSGVIIPQLREAIEVSGAVPGRIAIELTENLFASDAAAVSKVLEEVQGLGVSVVLDDFGTGYSSLSYLSKLPFDGVKTDRSFVSGIDSEPARAAVTQAMVTMAHSLGLVAVVEGVEHQRELRVLTEQGYDQYQGWLASPAVPPDEFGSLLTPARFANT